MSTTTPLPPFYPTTGVVFNKKTWRNFINGLVDEGSMLLFVSVSTISIIQLAKLEAMNYECGGW
jgi:hypothetical protein